MYLSATDFKVGLCCTCTCKNVLDYISEYLSSGGHVQFDWVWGRSPLWGAARHSPWCRVQLLHA